MFERKIGAKVHYYWTETVNDVLVKQSDLFSNREEMLRLMHDELKKCRVEGTIFQPMINQEGECSEWGTPEGTAPEYYVRRVLADGTEEQASVCWTFPEAVQCADMQSGKAFVSNAENTLIFYIKEAH